MRASTSLYQHLVATNKNGYYHSRQYFDKIENKDLYASTFPMLDRNTNNTVILGDSHINKSANIMLEQKIDYLAQKKS